MRNQKILYCVGDSHSQFFLGRDKMVRDGAPMRSFIPFFEVHHTGASLAYNLSKTGSSSRGRERLFDVLNSLPRDAQVLLSFGEIDCRCHVVRQMREQNRSMPLVVKDIASHYLSVILEIVALGFRVIVWGPPPSARDDAPVNPEFPAVGSCAERNQALALLERYLQEGLKDSEVRYLSLLDQLIDRGLITKPRCLYDGVHLSQRFMPVTILKLHSMKAIGFCSLCAYFFLLLPFLSGPYNLFLKFFRQYLKPLLSRCLRPAQ